MIKEPIYSLVIAIVIIALAAAAQAQEPEDKGASNSAPRSFGGPESVDSRLKRRDELLGKRYIFTGLDSFWQPWYGWKKQRTEKNGFNVGFSAWMLYQNASEETDGEDDAAGGIYRLQGSWTITGKDTPNYGAINFRVEKRSTIGSGLSPSQLGGDLSSGATNSAFLYSPDFRTDLSVFNFSQRFADGTAGIVLGRLPFDAYLDPYAFQGISSGFNNRAFVVNPTLGTTGIGALGAVLKGFVTDQILLGVGIYDGNAISGDFDIDTIEEGEYLKSAEITWSPSVARYKTDKIQLTYWHKDARTAAGVESGQGWVMSATWKVGERWMPFLRLGDSDGGAGTQAEKAISTGFEYTPRVNEALSVGLGWAKPSQGDREIAPDDEFVAEVSYKFQFSRNFSITPDVQLIFNPSNTPEVDKVWVVGVRGVLAL
jgi:porin